MEGQGAPLAPVLVACSIPSSWHHPAPRLALLWRLAGCRLRHQRVPGAALVGVGSHSDPCRLPDTEAKRGPASCGSSPLAPKPQTHVDLGHRPPPRCPFPTTVECPRVRSPGPYFSCCLRSPWAGVLHTRSPPMSIPCRCRVVVARVPFPCPPPLPSPRLAPPQETFESGPPVVAVMLRARQPQLECPERLRRYR